MINDLRTRMRNRIDETPRRWTGGLRRMLEARAIQGSNTIEGIDASLDDVLAVMDGEPPLDADTATRLSLEGFQEAMTYALQASQDDAPYVDEGLLKALHFMMLKHDLSKLPGRWRNGPIYVYDEEKEAQVYEGPPHDSIPVLIQQLVEDLDNPLFGGSRYSASGPRSDGSSESCDDSPVQGWQWADGAVPADLRARARKDDGPSLLKHRGIPRDEGKHARVLRRLGPSWRGFMASRKRRASMGSLLSNRTLPTSTNCPSTHRAG